MSTLLIISSLVHFSVLSPATYHACACAPHPHPSSYSLSSRSLCIMLLCDRWGAAARHPVLGTAGHRGEGKARRLTEIRPLIRRCDEVLRVCVCGGGVTDRHPGHPNQQQLDTSAISDQPGVPGTATRSAAHRLSTSFTAPPPVLPRCHPTRRFEEILMALRARRHAATAQQRVMNIHPGFGALAQQNKGRHQARRRRRQEA